MGKRWFGTRRPAAPAADPKLPAEHPDIVEPGFLAAVELCRPATMTSIERLYALYNAVRYVTTAVVPGAFVECGVWKGGSVMMMALALLERGVTDRDIYLFDTFAGMTPPTDKDVDYRGARASALLEREGRETNTFWAYSPREEVRANLAKTGYPAERFVFVEGDVLATIPASAPPHIALLRLDTDWYESTRHEMEHLFPRLENRGVLIVDDYGYYQGARQAVDEYLARDPRSYLMNRIDFTGRLIVKC